MEGENRFFAGTMKGKKTANVSFCVAAFCVGILTFATGCSGSVRSNNTKLEINDPPQENPPPQLP